MDFTNDVLPILRKAFGLIWLVFKHFFLFMWWLIRVEVWIFYYWLIGRWLFGLRLYFPKYYEVWFKSKKKDHYNSNYSYRDSSSTQYNSSKTSQESRSTQSSKKSSSNNRAKEIAKERVNRAKENLKRAKEAMARKKENPKIWAQYPKNCGYPGKSGSYNQYEIDVFRAQHELEVAKKNLDSIH